MKYKFYNCECCGEGLAISEWDKELKQIYISFWKLGLRGIYPLMWRKRFQLIWRILTKGELWMDEVILSQETAKELGQDLIKLSEE